METIDVQAAPAAPIPALYAPLARLPEPNAEGLTRRAEVVLRTMNAMTVESDDDYAAVVTEIRDIKQRHADYDAERRSITDPLNAVVKTINARYKPVLEALEQAETIGKRICVAYTTEKERRAAEEQRLRDEAAAAERRRLAEEEERIRREAAEAQAALQEQQRAAEAAGDTATAQQAAQQAEQVNQTALFEQQAVQQTAALIVAPTVEVARPAVKGASVAKSYDFRIISLADLVCHIAGVDKLAHPELLPLVAVDEIRMRAQVKATGAATSLRGVEVFPKASMRIGK